MPLHDWTRVQAGIFHDFHQAWITEFRNVLNCGLLPKDYYALSEQVTTGGNPDVLALHHPSEDDLPQNGSSGGTAVLAPPRMQTLAPRTQLVVQADRENYTQMQRRIAIRHNASGDRVIAMIEIVSPGNKSSTYQWDTFVNKTLGALSKGIHLLILDLFPPSPRDPSGVHGSVWEQLTGDAYQHPPAADRTLVAYSAGLVKTAYIEPIAVGQPFREMPLFLTPEGYVEVPLEATYQAAFAGVPEQYRRAVG